MSNVGLRQYNRIYDEAIIL